MTAGTEKPKRRWTGWLIRLVLAMVVLLWVAQMWVIPRYVRQAVREQLRQYWSGDITVDDVEVNLLSPSIVRGLTFRDKTDHEWLRVRSVRVELSGIVRGTVEIHSVEVEDVTISPIFVNGVSIVPLRLNGTESNFGGEDESIDDMLDRFFSRFKDFSLDVRNVTIRAAREVDWGVARPRVMGYASTEGIVLGSAVERFLEHVEIPSITIRNRHLSVRNVSGLLCGGRIWMEANARILPGQGLQTSGEMTVDGVDMADFSKAIGGITMQKGVARASLDLAMSSTDVRTLNGTGAVFIDESDVWKLPVVSLLFRGLGLSRQQSDIRLSFEMIGPILRIENGQLANEISAIWAEPNGTINLQTGMMDFNVIPVPLKYLNRLLRTLRLLDPMRVVTDPISRVRVKGHWGQSPSKLMKKEAIKDVKQVPAEITDFFWGVLKSGGELTGDIFFRKADE